MEDLNMEQAPVLENKTETEENKREIAENKEPGKVGVSIGKFKDTAALLKAYTNLEAEFTKKSQQLSKANELLNQIDNADNANAPGLPEYKTDNWKESVKNFIEKYPNAKNFISLISETICGDEQLSKKENCLEAAYLKVLNEKFKTPEQILNDEEFIDNHVLKNDKVKKKVLINYLKSKSENLSPNLLAASGSYTLSPVNLPKTIQEAGELAKKMLKDV